MCGIYGYSFRTGGREGQAFLEQAVARQQHRGPDGWGIARSDTAGIAMVRLRIRADEREPEPIPLGPGRHSAYNGEVYLDGGGRVPGGGRGEVEALLAEDPRRPADGMYALAVLDQAEDRIDLRRDPYGIKPLFLRRTADGVLFSSELAPLVTGAGKVEIRRAAIAQFLAFGRPLDGGGFLAEVESLPPGGSAELRKGECRIAAGPWPTERLLGEAGAPAPSGAELRAAIGRAVASTLVSNRPLGVAVSGGLDSTILCAELNELGIRDLHLVSVRMRGSEDGLTSLAQLGLRGDGWKSWTLHHQQFEPEDYFAELKRAVRILGEPTRMSSLPLYTRLADQAAAAGITTLLVGEGADELFCGYRTYLPFLAGERLRDYLYKPRVRELVEGLLAPAGARALDEAFDAYAAALPGGSDWEKLRISEFAHCLEPLLRRADHALMHRSIEGRTPFLHGDVAALAFRLPRARQLGGGQTKRALREAYAELLPDHFATEVKRHFRAPIADWFAGPLLAELTAELARGADTLADLGVDPSRVTGLLERVARGEDEAANTAYKLLTIVYWVDWLSELGTIGAPRSLAA